MRKISRRLILIAAILALVFLVGSYFRKPAVEAFSSDIYTQEDYDVAVTVVKRQYSSLTSPTLLKIGYSGDEWTLSQQEYILHFGDYTEGIVLYSDFYIPKYFRNSWEAGETYRNWQWYLARKDGGDWTVVTSGYG